MNSLPSIWAHRGASRAAPENSARAVEEARARRADGVELDVRLCASGDVVVFHDADLCAFGRPERVDSLPFAALRRIDLGAGERVATLDEVLDAAGADLAVNLELKERTLRGDALERAVARVVRRRDASLRERLWFSSFNPMSLARIARALGGVRLAFLFHAGQSLAWRRGFAALLSRRAGVAVFGGGFGAPRLAALHPEHGLATAPLVARAHAAGLRVHAWTIDRDDEARRLASIGVDAIITNEPDRVRAALEGAPPRTAREAA